MTVGSRGEDPFTAARNRLVDQDVAGAGVKNPRVIEAIRLTPRHEFMPHDQQQLAYFDMAVPIGYGQTISPPFVVASMTERLDPQPINRVLEIGTGSGYQAAVLSGLVAEVYSIEIVEALGRRAAATLARLDYDNVKTKIGDGYQGWAEHAPFDKIIVTCSPEKVPRPLVDELKEGGRMIVPIGERYQQMLYLFKKVDGELISEALEPTFFVPMTGEAEERRERKPDPTRPEIVNGGFEEAESIEGQPDGWYYVRQATLEVDQFAPAGGQCLTFSNDTPGRGAQALQAIGVDGREVERLQISCWVRADNLRAGRTADEQARLMITFFDSTRAPVRRFELGPWSGTFRWTRERMRIDVPRTARGAVIGIGLLGATGTLAFDEVAVERH